MIAKHDREIEQLELLIGDREEDAAEAQARTTINQHGADAPAQPWERRHPPRTPLPAHLPRETITHEPVYKRVRIFKIRKLPGRAVEPEGATARIRQVHRSIHEMTRGQMRHNSAQLKADAKPLTIRRAV